MSIFERRHSDALLSSPWLFKSTNDGEWMFKYAPHPDREGYVFVATNLEILVFESLTAPSIPSRLSSIHKSTDSASQRSDAVVLKQVEEVLDRLKVSMSFGKGWDGVNVEVKEHSFYDRVIRISRKDNFEWIFNTAELRSPIPLSFISKHLIFPLSTLFSLSTRPNDQIPLAMEGLGVLFDESFTSKIQEQSVRMSTGKVEDDTATPIDANIDQQDEEIQENKDRVEESLPIDPPPPAQPSPPLETLSPRESVSPVRRRSGGRFEDDPREKEQEEQEEQEDQEEEYRSSPSPSPSPPTPHFPPSSINHGRVPTSPTQINQSPPSPARPAPAVTAKPVLLKQARKETTDSIPLPTPSAPSQSSQKSKKERELEEEEEMEKRRLEMKRKMHNGGGGRLGKRRAGR